jgi:hypothetical protein
MIGTIEVVDQIGYTGSQGVVGFTGSIGFTGYTGSQGDVGFVGSQGIIGFTGSQGIIGFTGSKGDIGFTGSRGNVGYSGSRGLFGGVAFEYNYNTSLSNGDADPTIRNLRLNNSAVQSATAINISLEDINGSGTGNLLVTLDDSTNPVKGYIKIGPRENPALYNIYRISGNITDNISWLTIPVVWVSGSATSYSNEPVIFSFEVLGDMGFTGSQGSGFVGSEGYIGSLGFIGSQGNIGFSGSQGQPAPQNLPVNSQASAYTLSLSDVGKVVISTTGGITIPINIFTSGDVITIYNNSTSTQVISSGTNTVHLVGTSLTGDRTLSQRGLATLLCVGTNTFVITGGILT